KAYLSELKPELNVVGFDELDPQVAEESIAMPAVRVEPEPAAAPAHGEDTVVHGPAQHEPPEQIDALAAEFKAKPGVGTVTSMGDLCAAHAQKENALSCYRVAAVKFARHGLLAQSLLCAKLMLEQRATSDVMLDVAALPSLVGKSDERIWPYYFRGGGPVE